MFHVVIEDNEHESEDAGDELGGLFQVRRPDRESKEKANALDCSKFLIEKPQDWDLEEVMHLHNCFCKSYNGYVLGMSSKALLNCSGGVALKQTYARDNECHIFCYLSH